MIIRNIIILSGLVIGSLSVQAGDVSIRSVEFTEVGSGWKVRVTLEHADTGWEHYADAWRIVDSKGTELAKRVLHHPHVNEQPFTRSLAGVKIPADVTQVYIEAHDKVHGWSKDRVKVDLHTSHGDRYQVRR